MISRQIEFLKLLRAQSEYKPASFFAQGLSVSTKTIYNDINNLQATLKEWNIELASSPRNGIKLVGDEQIIKQMISEISNESIKDEFLPVNRRNNMIKTILLEDQKPNLDDLSNLYLVSKTSLYQDLAVINNIFQLENTELKVTNHGIVANGFEISLQEAVKKYIFISNHVNSLSELKSQLKILFEPNMLDYIFNLLLEEYSELTNEVSIYYMKSMVVTLLIQVARLNHNHHVELEETFLFNNIRYMETYIVANSIVESLEREFKIDFNNADIEYLCRQLFAHRITTSLKASDNEYASLVKEIIEVMSRVEKIDLNSDAKLYRSLIYHVPAMILRLKKGIHIENPLLDSIKDQYSQLFSIVWYALSLIESRYNVTLNDDEVSLILIHFQIALDSISRANNILIVCPYGVSSSQLILSKVKQLLPAKDNIEVSNISKLYITDLSNVDLIITSVELDEIMVPYVKVSAIVTNNDYINIMDAYSKYVLFKKDVLNKLDSFSAPSLSRFLDPTLISLHKKYDNKEICLNEMVKELEKRHYVTEKFRDSIFNREKVGVTCMDSGVALPHADPATIITSSVSILTLAKPVDWGGNLVSLIIMVCLSENDIEMFKAVINEIYQIIVKKEYVDQIIRINNIDSMIGLFYEK